MAVTNPIATGANSSTGDMRHIRNTPAVTMVAAWIRAETGVGPSIASGSQVCRKSCADLPAAPTNRSTATSSAALTSSHRNDTCVAAISGAAAKMSSNPIESVTRNRAKMPRRKAKSPTRLTTKALRAAALALRLRK